MAISIETNLLGPFYTKCMDLFAAKSFMIITMPQTQDIDSEKITKWFPRKTASFISPCIRIRESIIQAADTWI